MFDRFTDRARKVMGLARQEAQRLNHEYIGTEHILLGLVQEESGVAANVLKNMDVDLKKIRIEVEKLVQNGGATVTILASGLDRPSPVGNRRLAKRILACGGAWLSEYAPGEHALAYRFPERNRLIIAPRAEVFTQLPT